MTVLEIVNAKVNDATITEAEIEIAIAEVEQVIKNYCNIAEVPAELNFTWANMAVDLVNHTNATTTPAGDVVGEIESGDISGIAVGDTQISLKGGTANSVRGKALKSYQANLNDITYNYREQLNKFRRLVW